MDGFGPPPSSRVLRAPSLKRGRLDERITDRIKLERVLGVTVSSNAALASDFNTETVAYPAGCTIVLFNTHTGHQSHIINSSRKTILSLAFSSCGRYLVTGECGHQPAVRVWDLKSDPMPGPGGVAPQVQQVAEFLSHKHGISCVAFSPSGKYVVSIGTQHDMIVNVWDWKNNIKVASNKVSTKVKALAFAENGSYFVTVGNRHVKFWFLEYGKTKYKEAVPLMGRSAILGEQRNNYFCDVACGKGQCGDSTFAITRSGLLCEFNNRRLLDKWVELRTTSANCISVGESLIFVGCADGIVRCFDPTTLRFVTTLPRTHYLGVDVSQGLNITHMSSPPPDAKYPDAVAITFDESNKKLTCVYNDHSIYVWDINNIKRVGKSHSFLYHSACIWGVEMSPPNCPLPPGSFLTCSSDDTIRVWTLDNLPNKTSQGIYQKNIYSNELLKVIYIDSDMTYLKDLEISVNNTGNEKNDTYDSKNGVRAIRLSPDGKNLASGDRSGNIRIHETTRMTEDFKIEAHDAEVLCLEYTQTNTEQKLLASASRDRLIHVFDVDQNYQFLQTLDDHSSSITAVRFMNTPENLQMVSSSADKSLIFRSLNETASGNLQFVRDHHAAGKTTLYDMEVDTGQKHVLTACQDRNIRIYSVASGKHVRIFKGSSGDDGTLIKVALDRSGIYLATSCTDKSLSVYDYYTGECMATMCGHSELATGLRFTNDCRRLISASGDGCIFVWRVPHDMVVTMQARLSQQAMRQGKTISNELFVDSSNVDFFDTNSNNIENDYRFSVGALPLWAKKHISDDTGPPAPFSKGVAAPKGRWAQRAERNVGMKSIYTDSIISFPSLHDKRGDSDDKDSSLDSGTETRHYSEMIRESKIISKLIPSTRDSALGGSVRDTDIESTAHDADIDSDQEYRHQPMYYPTQHDSASGSEFIITNMDADELRRSQRRSKRSNLPNILIPTSVSGSQDSDEEDDEVSTPSGENTDRNPMSMLSVSSESLDQIVHREKYLQSTFDSLSGAETQSTPIKKSSLSSQYLIRTNGTLGTRNIAVINAAKQTKNDSDAARKREELAKRIAATRQQLQNVGFSSPLKYSQSIHDLSYIPEKEKWNSPSKQEIESSREQTLVLPSSFSLPSNLQLCGCYMKDIARNTSFLNPIYNTNLDHNNANVIGSVKLSDLNKVQKNPVSAVRPRKLQLDKKISKYKLNKSLPVSPVSEERSFSDFAQRSASNYASKNISRRSFSYFIDINQQNSTADDIKQVCSDIEQFSRNFSEANDQVEDSLNYPKSLDSTDSFYNEVPVEDDHFSSDSLEDCSFNSAQNKKIRKYKVPRRCLSNNEIYKYQMEAYEIPKSESFYLNPSNKNSQESILSDDLLGDGSKSYCNSLESVLSCESDSKSAPLEVLFSSYKKPQYNEPCGASTSQSCGNFGGSLPKNYNAQFDSPVRLKTSQTQTDFTFETPEEIVAKKNCSNSDFQQKLLKFETCIAQNENYNVQHSTRGTKKKGVAFFIETEVLNHPKDIIETVKAVKQCGSEIVEKNTKQAKDKHKPNNQGAMIIPTLQMKNKQYESKFCNVLNNKSELNLEIYESGTKLNEKSNENNMFVLTEKNSSSNRNQVQETSSLDRHLFTKNLLEADRIIHKPPKGVRRNSSKSRKSKTTYEYVKKEDFIKKMNNLQNVKTIKTNDGLNKNENIENEVDSMEFSYKEKNVDRDCENGNCKREEVKLLNELYDSLDKIDLNSKVEFDSLEVNINRVETEEKAFDSLDYSFINVWGPNSKNSQYNIWKNNCEKLKLEEQNNSGFSLSSDFSSLEIDRIQFAIENIKILNEIQRKISKINTLVDVFKQNMFSGKVKTLSQVYETLTTSQSFYNDLVKSPVPQVKFRRRNLSLPNFVERRLNVVGNKEEKSKLNPSKSPESERSAKLNKDDNNDPCCVDLDVKTQELPEPPNLQVQLDANSSNSGLRRSCSLSDISMKAPIVQKRKIEQVSGKKVKNTSKFTSRTSESTSTRHNSRYSKSNSTITRSRSTGVLNQSDSDNESNVQKLQNRLMRPTISSQNKVSATNKNVTMRKRQSYSVMNLSTVGQEDSSSEENERTILSKPAVPPRTRNFTENGQSGVSRKYATNKEKIKNNRLTLSLYDSRKSSLDDTLTNFDGNNLEDLNVSTIHLSSQLCDEVAFQLTNTANNVVGLYKRITDSDNSTNDQLTSNQKRDMVKNLELSIARTFKTLQDVLLEKLRQNNNSFDVQQTNTVKRLKELVSKGLSNDQNTVVNMMQQYSDILLSMMQQKIQTTNS